MVRRPALQYPVAGCAIGWCPFRFHRSADRRAGLICINPQWLATTNLRKTFDQREGKHHV